MDKEQALHEFWASFLLPAYDENTVPLSAEMPYITYEVATSEIDYTVSLNASLWYRSTSWSSATEKANEISAGIGQGGALIPYNNGALWISRGTPFAQRMADDDDSIRRIVLNIDAEYISAD